MLKSVKKRFKIQITVANQSINKTFELDKSIKTIKGLALSSNRMDLLYQRGEQKIEINSEEYFPEDYESKMLLSGLNVSVNDKYYRLGEVNAGNGNIKILFKDTDDGLTVFSPYTVNFYFDCDREDGL